MNTVRLFARRGYLLVLLLLLTRVATAQAPPWQSARAIGVDGSTSTYPRALVAGPNGDMYILGLFAGTMAFFGSITVTNVAPGNGFVAKWSSSRNDFAWVQKLEGVNLNWGAVAVSGNSLYVAGTFDAPSIQLGSYTLTNANTNLSRARTTDVVVVKLTDNGSSPAVTWAQSFGTDANEVSMALAATSNSVYLTGYFYRSITLGNTTLTGASLTGGANTFVTKLIDAGSTASVAWAQKIGNALYGSATPRQLAVSGTAVYVTGEFDADIVEAGSTTLTNADPYNSGATIHHTDVFLARLNDAGASSSFAWAQRLGGSGIDQSQAMVANGTALYVHGGFVPGATIGSTPLSGSGSLVSLVKLSDTGSLGWAQSGGGLLAVRGSEVYMTGSVSGAQQQFGPYTITNNNPNNSSVIYVAKLTDNGSAGTYQWVQQAPCVRAGYPRCLALDGQRVYLAGNVSAAGTFGRSTLAGPTDYLAVLEDGLVSSTASARGSSLAFYPNPVHGRATVQLPAGATALTLADALGRTVRTQAVNGVTSELDLRGLTPGLYQVRVQAGEHQLSHKFMVE